MALRLEELDAASLTKAMKGARTSKAKGEAALAYLARLDAERPSRRGRSGGGGSDSPTAVVISDGRTLVKMRSGSPLAWHDGHAVWVRQRPDCEREYFATEAEARKPIRGGRLAKGTRIGTLPLARVQLRMRKFYGHYRFVRLESGEGSPEATAVHEAFCSVREEYRRLCGLISVKPGGPEHMPLRRLVDGEPQVEWLP